MLTDDSNSFRQRLLTFGLSDSAIQAAWPEWWSEDAETSISARAELRYSVARKLGLEPHSLLDEREGPRFVWHEPAVFKHLSGETDFEKSALTSFGSALGRMLIKGTRPGEVLLRNYPALELRAAILQTQSFVRLVDLLSLSWSFGIPTVHLRVFPLIRKRMAAMSVRLGDEHAILLGKDAVYPAQIAFYLAHELAHIYFGHIPDNEVLVDLDSTPDDEELDPEEDAADAFALELLTGSPNPEIISVGTGRGPRSLARAALNTAERVQIEPGTLAMCFGYSTGDWQSAIGALRHIYGEPKDVWQEVNNLALDQLSLSDLPNDIELYILKVLGQPN